MDRAARHLDDDFIDRHSDPGDPGDALLDNPAVLDASVRIAAIYGDLLGSGLDEAAVGQAMLGATVMLYKSVGLGTMLPAILRRVADRLDRERTAH
ncbi:hypothetical protein [Hephaestia mangrovi]|jgi:hypothetical protein|uniref:hypothetical protein n=1 Tax=Hephaestia mangrovi TaxID=2873268 RepID=UPI001CA68065|nr:hypothetical protein [Hephaestia mangrovi]MBY8828363.1 hypothetical protein [Hephaestia mangrovi]